MRARERACERKTAKTPAFSHTVGEAASRIAKKEYPQPVSQAAADGSLGLQSNHWSIAAFISLHQHGSNISLQSIV
jgi:hypothetical protein